MSTLKKWLSMVIVGLMIMSAAGVMGVFAAQEEYSENFDTKSSDLSTWENWTITAYSGPNSASLDTAPGDDPSNKSLKIVKDNSENPMHAVVKFTPLSGNIILEEKFMIDSAQVFYSKIPLVQDSNGNDVVHAMIHETNFMVHDGNSVAKTLGTVKVSSWNTLKISMDTEQKVFSLWLNGVKVASNFNFYIPGGQPGPNLAENVGQLDFYPAANTPASAPMDPPVAFYFDDIRVYEEVVEPSAPGLDENFNDMGGVLTDDWTLTNDDGANNTASVVSVPKAKGEENDQCLKIVKNNYVDDGMDATVNFTPLTGKVVYEGKFYLEKSNAYFAYLPQIIDSSKNPVMMVMIYYDTFYVHKGNEGGKPVGKVKIGEWNEVKVLMDTDLKISDVWLNGEKVVTGFPFYILDNQSGPNLAENVGGLRFLPKTEGEVTSFYFDDLKVYADTTPPPAPGLDENFDGLGDLTSATSWENWSFEGSWNATNTYASVTNPAPGAEATDKVLKLTRDNWEGNAYATVSFQPLTGMVVLEEEFYIDGNQAFYSYLPEVQDSSGNSAMVAMVHGDQFMIHNANGVASSVGTVKLNDWNTLKVTMDTDKKIFTAELNGTEVVKDNAYFVAENQPGTNKATDVGRVQFFTRAEAGASTSFYINNVKVYREKSSTALISSTVYNVIQTEGFETIAGVAEGTSVEDFSANLTPSSGGVIAVFASDGTTEKTGAMVTGDKVKVTSEDESTTRTYTVLIGDVPDFNVIVNDHFDSADGNTALVGWNLNGFGKLVQRPGGEAGDYALMLTRTSTGDATPAVRSFQPMSGKVVVSYDVRAENVKSVSHLPKICDEEKEALQIFFLENKLYASKAGGASVLQETVETGKWYSIKAVIDTDMDTYDVYINGAKVITGENLGSEAAGAVNAESINHLDFAPTIDASLPEGVNFYIDNLMVFAQEGPKLAGGALYKADGTKVSGTDAVPRNADYLLLSFNTTPDAQIDPSTLTESTVQLKTADGTSIPYTGTYDAKANTYKVKWNSMLAYGTEYICTVTTGIRDTNNLSLQQESTFSFTTLSTDYYVSAAGYYDGQGSAITSVGSNSTITAKVTFANETADAANATVIIARYKDGVCKGITYEDGTVQSTGDTISATITGVQAGETIRTFVWDSAATMRPIWAKAGSFTLN